MAGIMSSAGKPGIFCLVLLLTIFHAGNRSRPAAEERISVDAVEKNDPEKSYGEILLERIAEGDFKRRVIGWIDRST